MSPERSPQPASTDAQIERPQQYIADQTRLAEEIDVAITFDIHDLALGMGDIFIKDTKRMQLHRLDGETNLLDWAHDRTRPFLEPEKVIRNSQQVIRAGAANAGVTFRLAEYFGYLASDIEPPADGLLRELTTDKPGRVGLRRRRLMNGEAILGLPGYTAERLFEATSKVASETAQDTEATIVSYVMNALTTLNDDDAKVHDVDRLVGRWAKELLAIEEKDYLSETQKLTLRRGMYKKIFDRSVGIYQQLARLHNGEVDAPLRLLGFVSNEGQRLHELHSQRLDYVADCYRALQQRQQAHLALQGTIEIEEVPAEASSKPRIDYTPLVTHLAELQAGQAGLTAEWLPSRQSLRDTPFAELSRYFVAGGSGKEWQLSGFGKDRGWQILGLLERCVASMRLDATMTQQQLQLAVDQEAALVADHHMKSVWLQRQEPSFLYTTKLQADLGQPLDLIRQHWNDIKIVLLDELRIHPSIDVNLLAKIIFFHLPPPNPEG